MAQDTIFMKISLGNMPKWHGKLHLALVLCKVEVASQQAYVNNVASFTFNALAL